MSFGSPRCILNICAVSATCLAQGNKRVPVLFPKGAGSANLWLAFPFVAFASALFVCLSLVRSLHATSFVRHPRYQTTGALISDSYRGLVNVRRAARDLAHLPFHCISWAIPYLPGGLSNQLVISRSSELQAALDSIAVRFDLLRRPWMGRVNPSPQATGATSSNAAAAAATAPEDLQDQEAGTAPSAEATGQEREEVSETEPPLVPRVTTGVSSSQPTCTPPGSETAGAEEVDEVAPVDSPATEVLPVETNTLESLINRQEPKLKVFKPLKPKQSSRPEPLLRAERSRMLKTIR